MKCNYAELEGSGPETKNIIPQGMDSIMLNISAALVGRVP